MVYVYVDRHRLVIVIMIRPKNGKIALWPNTRVAKCTYYVSQKQNEFNNEKQWYNMWYKGARQQGALAP